MFERGGDNLLSIRDLAGNEEPFTDFRGLKRTRKVNGEKTISLTVLPTKANYHSFNMIEEETTITFGDEYVIKKLQERSIGKTYIKQAEAVHKLYVDLINKQQPQIHNGSITFNNYMQMVFEDTGYTFVAIDHFPARSFQNLGNDNRLALLQKGLERFQAEFELVGNEVRFKHQIGDDTDFQFRFGHNIKSISKEVDTTNLATVIRGKGDPELGIEAYYRSPNADIFGEIDAPPVEDERFTSEESLLEEMKARLQDTPEVSITIDFADLRAAGYPYTVPNEGDRVWVIYEPMDDLIIETRIMEIEEEFDVNLKPIKTTVTLANYKKTFAGTMFDNVQKQLRNIVNDDGVIRYSVLDEAVRIATEALQSAQTELIFENGIIARDKNDPNRLVLFNSEGIGISSDGGQTFREAITSDGFVLTAGAIGRLAANNIQIGPETEFAQNYDPSTKETPIGAQQKADQAELNAKGYADGKDSTLRQNLRLSAPLPTSIILNNNGITASTTDSNKYARLDYRGIFVRNGAIQVERPDGFNTIIDGYANLNFNVFSASPNFTSPLVDIQGAFFRTSYADEPVNMNFYTFRHEGRYLKLHLAYYMETHAGSTSGGLYVVRSNDGATLFTKIFTNQGSDSDEASYGDTFTIDLGTPTGSQRGIYLRLKSGSSSRYAHGRVIRIWQEG